MLMVVLTITSLIFLSTTDRFRLPIAKVTNTIEYISINNGPDEIGPYIDKAREHNTYTKLIVGDSVCHQLLNNLQEHNDDICILGSNAAITMAGQYILIREFLDSHSNATDIWLIIIPSSLSCYFDTNYGYTYVVMPNVKKGTINSLDDDTIEHLENVYGKFFLNSHVVSLLDRSAPMRKIYLNYLSSYREGYGHSPVSPISVKYISKIAKLCNERNVNFYLISGPVSDSDERKRVVEDILYNFNKSELFDLFPNYEKSVIYYPDYKFRDGIHFGGVYANQYCFNEIIRSMDDISLLKYLKFK